MVEGEEWWRCGVCGGGGEGRGGGGGVGKVGKVVGRRWRNPTWQACKPNCLNGLEGPETDPSPSGSKECVCSTPICFICGNPKLGGEGRGKGRKGRDIMPLFPPVTQAGGMYEVRQGGDPQLLHRHSTEMHKCQHSGSQEIDGDKSLSSGRDLSTPPDTVRPRCVQPCRCRKARHAGG